MTTHTTQQDKNNHRTAAFNYACGYNDHRQQETDRSQPWVDGFEFAEYWIKLNEQPSRPSMQDAFRAFKAQAWKIGDQFECTISNGDTVGGYITSIDGDRVHFISSGGKKLSVSLEALGVKS